ncbi:plasmid partitioning protein RepB [Rhizobium sp. KVB221]|uniref:Plasmid partitioning protein RepB n=1 Tax=Rhizobium setariae TaxID=2801340 RepID=A0A937CRE8_9HYPH|nr:plasmid partitioning protein RepB [Rhizobium setariae]MBL0375368.1 plasmid partitioning protein RepB [Rhizobium setariae]
MSRKDSKGMFAAVLGQLDNEPRQTMKSASPHLLKVAEGVRQIQERGELADMLLKDGERIVEIDPDKVLPSSIHDRFEGSYDDEAVLEIVESMRERGQIVPGLVRPAADRPGYFQIVFGRRRLAAAKTLGVKFKAAVRELSEEQAVIFQGEENTARQDLSFIEKCAFALAQEENGFRRETICASLSTSKSHVSEMIKIVASLPKEIIRAIGKAPGIGRGRWEEFSRVHMHPGNEGRAREFVSQSSFGRLASDARFQQLLTFLKNSPEKAPSEGASTETLKWEPGDRQVSVTVKRSPKSVTLAVSEGRGARFGAWISDNLDVLYQQFRKSGDSKTGD